MVLLPILLPPALPSSGAASAVTAISSLITPPSDSFTGDLAKPRLSQTATLFDGQTGGYPLLGLDAGLSTRGLGRGDTR